MKTIVVALGGNALGNNASQQKKKVQHAATSIAEMIKEGHHVAIAHGNGPQVGMINLAFDSLTKLHENYPMMPFAECGAMSQGYIGYHLQNALNETLRSENIKKRVATVITQVEVDENDPAFKKPSKPIGSFYDEKTAKEVTENLGYEMKEDAGRGYRRVVPSPKPVDILEKEVIQTLMDNDVIPITVGGGGIPVIRKNNGYEGIDAVIDKDFASSKLAESIKADMLVILTAVDRVRLHFGEPDEKPLDHVDAATMKSYMNDNHFHEGSMLPKVKAALDFVENNPNGKAVIASLEDAAKAIRGERGTTITNGRDHSE